MNGIYAGISAKSVGEFIVTLIIFVFVLFITYYVTKFIGNIQNAQMSNGNIQIIEAKRLAGNKQLVIVKVADDYYLIGLGKDEISLIGNVEGEKLVLPEKATSESFDSILEKIKNIREKKK